MSAIYIAGPMRGIKDFNFPAFMKAAQDLRNNGHTVFNPAERDIREHGPDICKSETGNLEEINKKGFNLRNALRDDLSWICQYADEVHMLPGWIQSKGATAEYHTAIALGLPVKFIQ